jgi:hypothetical protein
MPPLGIGIGDAVADFELGFGQAGKRPPSSSLGLKMIIKRLGVGVVLTVAAQAPALPSTMFDNQIFEVCSVSFKLSRRGRSEGSARSQ